MTTTTRSITSRVVLSIVTLGIYGIFWQADIGRGIARLRGDDQPNVARDTILGLLTLGIYWLYSTWKHATLLNDLRADQGRQSNDNMPAIVLITGLFGAWPASLALLQSELSDIEKGRARSNAAKSAEPVTLAELDDFDVRLEEAQKAWAVSTV